MDINELKMDHHLKIKTIGRDDSVEDVNHHAYEPTSYRVLEELVRSGVIKASNHVLDYGCGKGRVGFFLANRIGCQVTGIEYDQYMYRDALNNRQNCITKGGIEFIKTDAKDFIVGEMYDVAYFFNPFSVKILKSVIGKIVLSWYENPREIKLLFYYPSSEYVGYLMTIPELEFVDEIDCEHLYDNGNAREVIMVFHIKSI